MFGFRRNLVEYCITENIIMAGISHEFFKNLRLWLTVTSSSSLLETGSRRLLDCLLPSFLH